MLLNRSNCYDSKPFQALKNENNDIVSIRGGKSLRGRRVRRSGFTLIELMVVLTIMAVIAALAIPSLTGTSDAKKTLQAALEINGLIDQARLYATARNTHTYVFFENDTESRPNMVKVIGVASTDGTDYYNQEFEYNFEADKSAGRLTVLPATFHKFKNFNLTNSDYDYQVDRAQLGAEDRDQHDLIIKRFIFRDDEEFNYMIHFKPSGQAAGEFGGAIQPVSSIIEFGLLSTKGQKSTERPPDFVLFQVAGLTGQSKIYRQE